MKFRSWMTLFLMGFILWRLWITIIPNVRAYIDPYYTEGIYKNLERVFNESQYRKTKDPAIIPDQTVFSYAAGAYLHGVDPILVNSETTPLGKYAAGLFILILKNDKFVALPFGFATLIILFLLAKRILGDSSWALVPVAVVANDILFLNQLKTAPLLDIIQLPFIFLSILLFLVEYPKRRFIATAIALGLVMATKTHFPAFLLLGSFGIFLLMQKEMPTLVRLIITLPLSLGVLALSYTRTFLNGYTLLDFLGFQKWVILYQKSKLLYPFSVWRLIFLNQWQTWWGNMSVIAADDWQITWAIGTGLTFLFIFLLFRRRFPELKLPQFRESYTVWVLVWWVLVYGAFLSLGVVSSRFLLPFLPVAYILATHFIRYLFVTKI
ncbi:MAG: hypothetical protein US50_C0047G0004 [Candidatus Nomurabacteria bacterium GW2011_GWB1_37_5]|uniref:Glycosyltransferase RgtA/B/C/D-like domain-containing protein n=1 Tax=Candidatus Nomurabacteria bacterium GW2011_GWB1_37_5 TaxID=1618742 RepID=A0A0G0GWM2_9BACT|nr:MAG: hypothetical protein US50_C0047G0004 [Candidatus Nomurabacteria bacterium GW2011_GWB1_37_5]